MLGFLINRRHAEEQHVKEKAKRRGTTIRNRLIAALICSFGLVLNGCGSEEGPESLSIDGDGPIIVLTRNAPTTYYIDQENEPEGYEYRLVNAFAEEVGRGVEFRVLDSVEEIMQALSEKKGHMAAAGLTLTPARKEAFTAGPAYRDIKEQIVCRKGGPDPDSVKDLKNVELVVASETSYIEKLESLKERHPQLSWTVRPQTATEEILEDIWEERIECTLADSNIVAINRRYFPELRVTFSLKEQEKLVWYFPKEAQGFRKAAESWLSKARKEGLLEDLEERFYSYIPIFDYVDITVYKRRIRKRYPRYEDEFEDAGEEFGIPPLLLAAQAYQESHWDRKAKSPTGVRGIMMLTQSTAKRVGVDNRLDAEDSIFGGAEYMADIMSRLPDSIDPEDRYWFALAAYNIGMGHLFDARNLAESLGKNKDDWRDMREVLPLLGRKEYYTRLRYGYARGHEAVRYVARIRNYWDILQKAESG